MAAGRKFRSATFARGSTGLRPRARLRLDATGVLLLGLCAAVVAWRMLIAIFEIRASGETSMLLGVPTCYAYLLMTPSSALLAATGFYRSWLKSWGCEA